MAGSRRPRRDPHWREAAISTIEFDHAALSDLPAVAALWGRSRRIGLPFLPELHSRDEDIAFLARYVQADQLILARSDTLLVGFMALTPGWIEQLYLEPAQRGRGIGRALVNKAKAAQAQLSLWCFADNRAAQAFYLAEGFVEQRRTDGENEAGLPDILYGWQRPVSLSMARA